ncbi:MAG: RsmE family RNA methyltransferase [bacterium]
MDYFYTLPKNITSDSLTIEGEEFSHLAHVMRKPVGAQIIVVDGIGKAYEATIEEITKRAARCSIQTTNAGLHESPVDVTLAVGLLKNHSKFDFLIEKCTELGVNAFFPLITERTIPRHARTDRWQKLALAAMKQSERCILPKVHEPGSFTNFISSASAASLKIIPHEKIKSPTLGELLRKNTNASISICIGPEGGFTETEIAEAQSAGFLHVSLGERRLRTETAAIVAAAACLM